jgi:hypothetical protein
MNFCIATNFSKEYTVYTHTHKTLLTTVGCGVVRLRTLAALQSPLLM